MKGNEELLKTVIETTLVGDEVVKIMIWKFEKENTGSGTVAYRKAGYKE